MELNHLQNRVSKLGHGRKPHYRWLWNLLSKRALQPHHASKPTFHFFLLSFLSFYGFLICESTNRQIRQIVKGSSLLPDSHSLAHPASRPWRTPHIPLVAVPSWTSYEVLLAALNGLIPSSLLEQVRSSLPKPEKPLTERMMQVQSKLDEEKKTASSWKEAVKMREAALVEGRKNLADHMTEVEGLQAELSELETQFITQRKEKEEQERKDEREKLAATQVEIEQSPIPEDVDMEDGPGGKKRRRGSSGGYDV